MISSGACRRFILRNHIRRFSERTSQKFCSKYANFLDIVKNNGKHDEGKITCHCIQDNKVCEIVISNPKKRNSINGKMMCDFARIVDDVLFETKPFAVIIRGTGEFFCSGADLSLSLDEISTPGRGLQMSDFMTDALNSLRSADILSVAVLNGPALGGGAELATTCDWRIIDSSAYIQFVHARIGASPGWGGAARLINIVGRQQALRLLGTSERINTEEMLQIGLADMVVPSAEAIDSNVRHERLLQYAMNHLNPYLKQPYESSVRGIKSTVAATENDDVITMERRIFGRQWASQDNKQAISLFLSRQKSK